MEKNCYVITGGAGFIGSEIIEKILKEDPKAYIVSVDKKNLKDIENDLYSNFECFSEPDYGSLYKDERFMYLRLDILNGLDKGHFESSLKFCLEYYDENRFNNFTFIHCASPVGVSKHTNKDLYVDGYNLTTAIVNFATKLVVKGYKKVSIHFMSSSELYGDIVINDNKEVDEFVKLSDNIVFNKYIKNKFIGDRSSYFRQKLASEQLLLSKRDKLVVRIYRLFNIIGPKQNIEQGYIPKLLKAFKSEGDEILYIGTNTRTYTNVNFATNKIFNEIKDINENYDRNFIDNDLNTLNIVDPNKIFTDLKALKILLLSNDINYEQESLTLVEALKDGKFSNSFATALLNGVTIQSDEVLKLKLNNKTILVVSIFNEKEIHRREIGTLQNTNHNGYKELFKV